MTTPQPARTDRQPGEIIDNDDLNYVALVANRADTAARLAATQAEEALETAQSVTGIPSGGLTWADLSPSLRALLVTTGPGAGPPGTGLQFYPNPTTDPGSAADAQPSVWVGDIA